MLTKSQIAHIRSLKLRKFRDIHKEFVVEGEKIVGDLLKASFSFLQIYALPDWIERNSSLLRQKNISVQQISSKEIGRISSMKSPNKVLALAKIPEYTDQENLNFEELILVLDSVQDPGNMGTIIRTADWFGIHSIICSKNCADIYSPKVVQAGMGSFVKTKILYVDLPEFIENRVPKNIPIYGSLLEGESIYTQKLSTNGLIVIGNESQGISKELQVYITRKISIPAYLQGSEAPFAESLNAAVSGGIICAEFRRQQAL